MNNLSPYSQSIVNTKRPDPVIIRQPQSGGESPRPENMPKYNGVFAKNESGSYDKMKFTTLPKGFGLMDIPYLKTAEKYPLETRFRPTVQSGNAKMAVINEEIETQTKALAKDYYDGKISGEELKSRYKELAKQYFQGNFDNHFISGRDTAENKAMSEAFYTEFRRQGIGGATSACFEKGLEFRKGDPAAATYYNADYYYMSEDFTKAITEAASELSKENGLGEFEVPDYSGDSFALYNNFNTAWNGYRGRSMTDTSAVPPRGFEFYFQSGTQFRGSGSLPQQGYTLHAIEGSDVPTPNKSIEVTESAYVRFFYPFGAEKGFVEGSFSMVAGKSYSLVDYLQFSKENPPEESLLSYLRNFLVSSSMHDYGGA